MNNIDSEKTTRIIRCGLDDETYGLDMSWVSSIQRIDHLSLRRTDEDHTIVERNNVPLNKHDPAGWLPSSEGDIPVFSLGSLFGHPRLSSFLSDTTRRRGNLQRIIVLNPPKLWGNGNGEGKPWGLLVDRVSQVMEIPPDRLLPLPQVVINPSMNFFDRFIRLEDEFVLYLAPSRLYKEALQSHDPFLGFDLALEVEPGSEEPSPDDVNHGGSILTKVAITKMVDSKRNGNRQGQIVVFSTPESEIQDRPLYFGLSISQIPEILEHLPVIPVPGAPRFVEGLLNWRGRPVPLVDLSDRLNLISGSVGSPNGKSRLIIVRDKGVSAGSLNSGKGIPKEGEIAGERNQAVFGAFRIQPSIRVQRLPIDHKPCSRDLPLDHSLARGVVELEDETLLIPDIRALLRRSG